MINDWSGKIRRLAATALREGGIDRSVAQLRSATLLDEIRHETAAPPQYTFAESDLSAAAHLARLGELTRSPRQRRTDPRSLSLIASVFEDLAARAAPGSHKRTSLLAQAASMWSVAGYQASSVVGGRQTLSNLAAYVTEMVRKGAEG